MIVNPQLFNYRLIIGSLVVSIAVVSIFGFANYQSNQAQQQSLEQENKLIKIELSQMIKRYDEVSQTNELITNQLEQLKSDNQIVMDSLRLLLSQQTSVSEIKQQVAVLESRNRNLFNTVKFVKAKNEELEKEKLEVYNDIQNQKNTIQYLIEENNSLKESLKTSAVLTANSFKATALNKTLGKTIITSKASKTETIEVSFSLDENLLAESGEKDIYIQILTPENNVFADKGAVTFGESSLIYSFKKLVQYNNRLTDVSIAINAEDEDQPLTRGTYFINVFNKDKKLGSTQLQLD